MQILGMPSNNQHDACDRASSEREREREREREAKTYQCVIKVSGQWHVTRRLGSMTCHERVGSMYRSVMRMLGQWPITRRIKSVTCHARVGPVTCHARIGSVTCHTASRVSDLSHGESGQWPVTRRVGSAVCDARRPAAGSAPAGRVARCFWMVVGPACARSRLPQAGTDGAQALPAGRRCRQPSVTQWLTQWLRDSTTRRLWLGDSEMFRWSLNVAMWSEHSELAVHHRMEKTPTD